MRKKPTLQELTDVELQELRDRIEQLRFAPKQYKEGRLKQIDAEVQRRSGVKACE